MCGLVGVAGCTLAAKYDSMFKMLLYMDTVRGPDSTGVARLSYGKVETVKNIGTPWDLFKTLDGAKVLSVISSAYLGHNRLATKGGVTKLNAHPFTFGEITGAHNGTLTRQSRLPDFARFEVDSENIFYAMDKIGVAETVALLQGAYALTWINKEEKSINLLRNKERPLFYTYNEERTVLMWASEVFMLKSAAERCQVKLTRITRLPEDVLYTFTLPVGGKTFTAPLKTPLEGAIEESLYGSWASNWKRDSKRERESRRTSLTLVEKMTRGEAGLEIDGYGMSRLTFQEFKERTREVCVVCDGDVRFKDEDLFWIDANSCACGDCVSQTETGDRFVDFTEINRWS